MCPYLGEADIPAMLADLAETDSAVEVTHGTAATTALYDRVAVQIFDGEMPTTIPDGESVHIAAGSLPDLAPGDAITVDGVVYNVLRILAYGDGAMERLALTKPE